MQSGGSIEIEQLLALKKWCLYLLLVIIEAYGVFKKTVN